MNHPLAKIPDGSHCTPHLQYELCRQGQQAPFAVAARNLNEAYPRARVYGKMVDRTSHYWGECLKTPLKIPSPATGEFLYLMVDGSFVQTRPNLWKEVKLARVFPASARPETKEAARPSETSFYTGSFAEAAVFTQQVEQMLPADAKLVVVADGARWIWNWVEAAYPEATQILDFYHAMEHLGKLASAFMEPAAAQTWLKGVKARLQGDEIAGILSEIAGWKTRSGTKRAIWKTERAYLERNQKRMRYGTFLRQGLRIGSGAMESANRKVVQYRLKLSGQRWSEDGASRILALRTTFLSNQEDRLKALLRMEPHKAG